MKFQNPFFEQVIEHYNACKDYNATIKYIEDLIYDYCRMYCIHEPTMKWTIVNLKTMLYEYDRFGYRLVAMLRAELREFLHFRHDLTDGDIEAIIPPLRKEGSR